MAENRPDNIVEVVRDATGKSTDRLHAAGLLQASLETGSFLFELFPPHGVHDGVEGHAQQTKLSGFHNVATPQSVEAEDGTDGAFAHVRDAYPTAQTDGGEGLFVRAGWQPVHAPDVDVTLPGPAQPGHHCWRSIRPAWRECHSVPAPHVYLGRLTRHHEIRAVRVNKFRQFGQRSVDLRDNLTRLGVNQTRRDTGDHVLVCGAALQR